MSSHAVASKPYWRWLRFHRKRGTFHRGKGAVAKPWNGLVLIAAQATIQTIEAPVVLVPLGSGGRRHDRGHKQRRGNGRGSEATGNS